MPCFDLQHCNKNESKQREITIRLGRKAGLNYIGCLRESHSNSGQWQVKRGWKCYITVTRQQLGRPSEGSKWSFTNYRQIHQEDKAGPLVQIPDSWVQMHEEGSGRASLVALSRRWTRGSTSSFQSWTSWVMKRTDVGRRAELRGFILCSALRPAVL